MPAKNKTIGVILAQVGTPAEPTAKALRPYLKEFLSDERILDWPRWLWLPVLHGIVLQTRPRKIAHHYQEIWTKQGSPLMEISRQQVAGVQKRLGRRYKVVLGLAYTTPSMADAVRQLEDVGIREIVVLPLFPQFSTTTTASIYDEITRAVLGRKGRGKPIKKYSPTLRFIKPFFDDQAYIQMLARDIKSQVAALPQKPDQFILSYHGIPKRYVDEGDPYPQHCEETTRRLVKAMGWKKGQYRMTYQSRFGRAEWLQPYTQVALTELHGQGIKRPMIIAPGFTTDCLETLHELAIEGAELFEQGGGDPQALTVAACVNAKPGWLDYAADLIKQNTNGW